MLVVGSNKRRAQGGFDLSMLTYQIGPSPNPFQFLGEFFVMAAGAASAEGTDLLSGGPRPGDPDWDHPTRSAFRLWHTSFFGTGPTCYGPRLGQVTVRRADADATPTFTSDGILALDNKFNQCHLRFGRTVRWTDRVSGSESLFVGMRCKDSETAPESACFYKVRPAQPGGPLEFDLAWGGGDGQAIVKTSAGSDFRYFDHTVDPEGRLVIAAGIGSATAGFKANLVRLDGGGGLDTVFGNGGVQPIPAPGANTNPRTVTSGFGVGYQVTGETYTATSVRPFSYFHDPNDGTSKYSEYEFAGKPNSAFFSHVREPDGRLTAVGTWYPSYPGTADQRPLVARIVGPTVATEAFRYHHRDFDHAFVTSLPDEIAKLNAGVFGGWELTGESFHVYGAGTPGTRDQYRFFGASFGDKSSHFFTDDAAEAMLVMGNPDWFYEGKVSAVRALAANGECPADASPMLRAYNNGMGGAPNHLFTTSPSTLSMSLSLGYVAEGRAPLGRIACVEQ